MEVFQSPAAVKAEPGSDDFIYGIPNNSHHHSLRVASEETMSASSSTIRVAVVGGGLAGATLLRGLLRYSHIAADLYEARPSFKEDLPGIDLSPLAQAVLRAIDPSIDACLDRAGAVYTTSEVRMATGPLAGQRVRMNDQVASGKRTVGRQALLSELLSGIPPRMVHLNARVTSILESSPGHGLTLIFSDGSQKKYDVVVGADGVRGTTRDYALGSGDFVQNPKPTGLWSLPIKVSTDRARQMIGTEAIDPRNPRQVTWVGEGTMMQHGPLSNGREVQVTMAATQDASAGEFSWVKMFTPEEFEKMFSGNQCPPCQGMIKLVQSIYTVSVATICQMQPSPTPTYSSRSACLIDCAAHGVSSSSSSIHSTSSTAMEEALILTTLLGRTTSRAGVPAALRAYDEVCRPRAELVMRAAADIGTLLTGRGPGVGLNPGLLGRALEQSYNTIQNLDVGAYCMMAIETMDRWSHASYRR